MEWIPVDLGIGLGQPSSPKSSPASPTTSVSTTSALALEGSDRPRLLVGSVGQPMANRTQTGLPVLQKLDHVDLGVEEGGKSLLGHRDGV